MLRPQSLAVQMITTSIWFHVDSILQSIARNVWTKDLVRQDQDVDFPCPKCFKTVTPRREWVIRNKTMYRDVGSATTLSDNVAVNI